MFDFHNHFTDINAFKYSAELLPQNLTDNYDITLVGKSEIGLDKRFVNRISMDKQVEELKKMLLYANRNNIGISLHCVHATELMLKLLKEITPNPFKTVWHGFNGSKETAQILFKLDVIVSINPKFNGNLTEIYNSNPLLVLETDYEGNSENEYNTLLREHYLICSKQLGIPLIALEERCNELKLAFKN